MRRVVNGEGVRRGVARVASERITGWHVLHSV